MSLYYADILLIFTTPNPGAGASTLQLRVTKTTTSPLEWSRTVAISEMSVGTCGDWSALFCANFHGDTRRPKRVPIGFRKCAWYLLCRSVDDTHNFLHLRKGRDSLVAIDQPSIRRIQLPCTVALCSNKNGDARKRIKAVAFDRSRFISFLILWCAFCQETDTVTTRTTPSFAVSFA